MSDRIDTRVHELLDLVGLDPERYGRRFPHELSGGDAIGRSGDPLGQVRRDRARTAADVEQGQTRAQVWQQVGG